MSVDSQRVLTGGRTEEATQETKNQESSDVGRKGASKVEQDEEGKSGAVDWIAAIDFRQGCKDEGPGSKAEQECADTQGCDGPRAIQMLRDTWNRGRLYG